VRRTAGAGTRPTGLRAQSPGATAKATRLRHVPHVAVDQGHVELVLGGELLARVLEPATHQVGVLGAAPGEPADQLVPGRRGEEDQGGVGHRGPDLAGALEVDLEDH
jgi:hypothetical protein